MSQVKRSNRVVVVCKSCSKPKDAKDGRYVREIFSQTKPKTKLYERESWICFECLPLDATEELTEI